MKEVLFCLSYLFRLAGRTDRKRLAVGGGLLLLGALATPAVALSVKGLVNATIDRHPGDATWWALATAIALLGELNLSHFAHLYYFELAEITEERLNRDLLRVINGSRGL